MNKSLSIAPLVIAMASCASYNSVLKPQTPDLDHSEISNNGLLHPDVVRKSLLEVIGAEEAEGADRVKCGTYDRDTYLYFDPYAELREFYDNAKKKYQGDWKRFVKIKGTKEKHQKLFDPREELFAFYDFLSEQHPKKWQRYLSADSAIFQKSECALLTARLKMCCVFTGYIDDYAKKNFKSIWRNKR